MNIERLKDWENLVGATVAIRRAGLTISGCLEAVYEDPESVYQIRVALAGGRTLQVGANERVWVEYVKTPDYYRGVDRVLEYVRSIHAYPVLVEELEWAKGQGIL